MEQNIQSKSIGDRLFDKIKPYLKIYRNNRDIIFTLYAAMWFLFCTYVVSLANSYADRTNTNVNNEEQDEDYIAPDALLGKANELYEKYTWIPREIADYIVRFSAALIILRALTLKSYSLTVTRRILYVMGFVYLLRACFIPLTVLPTPWVTCKKSYKDNIFYDAFLIVLQIRAACGDVFFSGHTIMFTLNIVEYWYYCKKIWINILVTIMNVVGMYTLVMASYHYSIDILCAFIFSIMFWVIYHWAIRIPDLGTTWWGNIINYFDDPFFYEHSELPVAYEPNANENEGPANVSDITDLSPQNKFEENNNPDRGNQGTAINELTLLYELNKEQQRKNSLKNINKNEDTDFSEEENIYKRKSKMSDTSLDNISNLNSSLNNVIDISSQMNEEIIQDESKNKYLSPNNGNKNYKHNSINSLASDSNKSRSNIPPYVNRNSQSSSSNQSIGASSSLSQRLSIGKSSVKSKSIKTSPSSGHRKINHEESTSSKSSLNTGISYSIKNDPIKGQNISPIQPLQPFEPTRDMLKDTNSYYSGSGIIKSDSRNDGNSIQANISNINPNGVAQFQTKGVETLSIDSIKETNI